jgi:hypothetical protein
MLPSLPATLLGGLFALTTLTAGAQGPGALTATDAYTLAVPPGQPNSAVFLTLTNNSAEPRALVAGATPIAQVVELHNHTFEGGMMRMRPVERIEVPAGASVQLEPRGFHVMLIGLKGNLQPGDPVDLTLTFDDGTQIQVDAPVRKASAGTTAH